MCIKQEKWEMVSSTEFAQSVNSRKNGPFSHLCLSWQAPTNLTPSVISLPAPVHGVCAALDWPTYILRKFSAFFCIVWGFLGFFKAWSPIVFLLCIWNGCPHLVCQILNLSFLKLTHKFPLFVTVTFHNGNSTIENICSYVYPPKSNWLLWWRISPTASFSTEH